MAVVVETKGVGEGNNGRDRLNKVFVDGHHHHF